MIIAVGYADKSAKVPRAAKIKKPLEDVLTFFIVFCRVGLGSSAD